ncbi:hypothetical protein [Bradyrhizobium nitroreducens]|nr:hypothetical protein [Bradyrhizobium nitroreducens]
MTRPPRQLAEHVGMHLGIHYSLKPNAAPRYWRYVYAVADRVRSGLG